MTSNPTVLAAALAVAAAAPLQAQLAVGEIGTAAVIDFNSAIANVNSYSAEATGTNANIYEPNNTAFTGNTVTGLSSRAWSTAPISNPFADDANGNGQTNNAITITSSRFRTLTSETYAVLGASGNGNRALGLAVSDVNSLPGGAGNGTLTLRIQNTTGGTVTDWSFFADAWYASTGTTATLTFAYSTDNVNFTTFDTRTSTATTSAFNGATTRLDTTQWSSQQKFGDSFSATVLDQEYLYISFTTHNNGVGAGGFQAGAHWILDNLAITAIPEPSAFALLFGVGALGAVALRRRRR